MKFFDDFKAFAIRGNVIDLAVGIIIGAAFGRIVSSLVADIIMPPVGLLIGGINFTDLKVILKAATQSKPAVTWNIGTFIQTVLDFLIVAFSVFLVVKGIMLSRRKEEAAPVPPAPKKEEVLLTEIRDLLKVNR